MNKIIILLFITLSSVQINAQKIEVNCTEKPLNELLIEWRELYNLQFSFNDELLSQFLITKSHTYPTTDEAISDILSGLPLSYQKSNHVYIIFEKEITDHALTYLLSGKVIEKGTGEPLPFSHIAINNYQTITDIKGTFSNTFNESSFHVTATHLGYYKLDTLLVAGEFHTIELTPSFVGLPEVKVTNNIVEKSAQVGEQPGMIKLNHQIAGYLPGNGDNSVFNLLKLQPGITASGENPNDLILWGSSEGTSIVQFDGFTIWGLKNLNDNISAVNPYMVKSIDVNKGGYNATYSDFIGGIVDIYGRNGNRLKPSFRFFINNQTINSLLELPIGNKSSLVAAYRQNYYDLLSSNDVQIQEVTNINRLNWEYNKPDYTFKDLNIKYSFQGDNGDLFYISALGGGDDLKINAKRDSTYNRPNGNLTINESLDVSEKTNQSGASVFYGKTFSPSYSSSLKFSYSFYDNDYSVQSYRTIRDTERLRYSREATNEIMEFKSNWQNEFQVRRNHQIKSGMSFIQNNTMLKEQLNNSTNIDLISHASRLAFYTQDELKLMKDLKLMAGIRLNYPTHIKQPNLDPRIALSYKPGLLKLNASWGIYHQYIVRTSIMDEDNRIRYAWYVGGYNNVPILRSEHTVLSAAYTSNHFLISLDTYFKKNSNLTRYIQYSQSSYISDGESKSYGLDVYLKKDFNGHSVWTSYSLGRTEEWYDYFPDKTYRRAPQDQTHEFKIAGLLNLGSIHASASYIYGSGFPLFTDNIKYEYIEPDYNRIDLSLIYQFTAQKFGGEIGLSILNVLNTNNVKYNSFQLLPIDEFNTVLVNEEAMKFTPLLHLKIEI